MHRTNQSAPADLPRGSANWRTDLVAYDALPPELREALREAPFEMDAASLLAGLQAAARHYGSEAMAIAAMGAQVGRFRGRCAGGRTPGPRGGAMTPLLLAALLTTSMAAVHPGYQAYLPSPGHGLPDLRTDTWFSAALCRRNGWRPLHKDGRALCRVPWKDWGGFSTPGTVGDMNSAVPATKAKATTPE